MAYELGRIKGRLAANHSADVVLSVLFIIKADWLNCKIILRPRSHVIKSYIL